MTTLQRTFGARRAALLAAMLTVSFLIAAGAPVIAETDGAACETSAAEQTATAAGASRAVVRDSLVEDPRTPRDLPVVQHLGIIESIMSIPPGGRPYPSLIPTTPPMMTLAGDEGPAPAPIAYSMPSSPQGTIPGVCVGGTNNGNPCTLPTNCPNGGVCNFYRSPMYQNEAASGFSSGAIPRTVLDDIGLAGPLAIPPARISSVEFAFVLDTGLLAGQTMLVEVRFWDTLNTAATPVNSGFIGGGAFLVPGPLAAGAWTFIGVLAPAAHGIPSDPNIAIQFDYRNNAGGALAFGTVFFSNGTGSGPQLGTSINQYFRDADGNGIFNPTDARNFAAPNLGNFYLHLGGEYPVAETEPNNTSGTASVTVSCLGLNAAITPAADVDWYKFTLGSPATTIMTVSCGSGSDDSTLTLRDSGLNQIAFSDDISVTNRCSSITQALAAGTYFLEVHENGDDATITSYRMEVGPPPPVVTGYRWTDIAHAVWDPLPSGGTYDFIFGDLVTLNTSGVTASVGSCLGEDLPTPAVTEGDIPGPGTGWWYLVRGKNTCTGGPATYDEGGGQVASRDPLIPPPPVDCNP